MLSSGIDILNTGDTKWLVHSIGIISLSKLVIVSIS